MSEKISYDQENKVVLATDKDWKFVSISKVDWKLVYHELEEKSWISKMKAKSLDWARDRVMFSNRFPTLRNELINILTHINS